MTSSPEPKTGKGQPQRAVFAQTLVGQTKQPSRRPPTVLQRGASIGRYVVLEKLGAGGMGIVYTAFDPELDRKIAVKLVRPGRGRNADIARARLVREAQALARLSHPSVVTVHDVGTLDDQVFIAMEFVDGCDWAAWLCERRRTWQEVLTIAKAAGEGLAAAHEAGVIHRDFKPENVLVGRDGRVRVVDFGLARTASDVETGPDNKRPRDTARPIDNPGPTESVARAPSVPSHVEGPTDLAPAVAANEVQTVAAQVRLTVDGTVMGTPPYMAPEQHRGQTTDERSDQWSFCVALYEALFGERPFAGRTLPELSFNVLGGRMRELPREGSSVPTWLRKVVLRGLVTNPDDRWPDMRALLTALGRDPTIRRRRIGVAVGLSAGLAALVALVTTDSAACQGAERRLVSVWDETIRSEVATSFSATELPYAADVLRYTNEQLDTYSAKWIAMHTDACEATHIHKEQSQDILDRQMLCLERRRKEVASLTGLLKQADKDMVQQAVKAVTQLRPLEPCADRDALLAESAPLTGDEAARLADIETLLADGQHKKNLAKFDEALEAARDALGAARAMGHAPSQAAAMVLMGTTHTQAGSVESSEKTLWDAVWLGDEAKADDVRAHAWVTLVWSLGVDQRRYADATAAGNHAEHALLRAGGDPIMLSLLHNNLGAVARRAGKAKSAIEHHRQALAIRRKHLADQDPRIGHSLINLASALTNVGQLEQSQAALEQAQEIFERAYGRRHPAFASVLHVAGVVAYKQSDYQRAADALKGSLSIREAVLDLDHPSLAEGNHDLGFVLLEGGRFADALPHFQRAVEIRQLRFADPHPGLANSLTGLGRTHLALGEPTAAIDPLRQADEIWKKIEDGGNVLGTDTAETWFALAQAIANEQPEAALKLAGQAKDLYEAATKPAQVAAIDRWLSHRGNR